MAKHFTFLGIALFTFFSVQVDAQKDILPIGNTLEESEGPAPADHRSVLGVEITTPPNFPVRTMAEWEEIQSIVIAWAGFEHILKQIAFHAKQECEVIIIADNANTVMNYLNSNNSGGDPFDNLDNITILEDDFNSIWMRDYGANTVYRDGVDELLLVDWIYNRNRPQDDFVPVTIAENKGVPLYMTSEAPYDLMATGGNFMADGMGTAFSSELILDENSGGTTWWGTEFPDHSETEVEGLLEDFMGIDRYIKMEVLPFDAIHHIDMHMKLLDEETLIIGEYPDGIADGPQIEANIEYVLSNFDSSFGTPYEIVRVEMPPEGGQYPNQNGAYRTYTNMVFLNGTVLVPVYQEAYDTPALEIIQAELPGYNVVGIECNDIIQLSGAIHCITKAVGVADPLLIIHNHLDDTTDDINDYVVDATIQHVSEISSATMSYSVDGSSYTDVAMNLTVPADDIWSASIPAQEVGAVVDYYIEATSNSAKTQVRPIVAPEGTWTFEVLGATVGLDEYEGINPIGELFPNPANAMTVVRLNLPNEVNLTLSVQDMLGRTVQEIYKGDVAFGEQTFFINAATLAPGAYSVVMTTGSQQFSKALLVR